MSLTRMLSARRFQPALTFVLCVTLFTLSRGTQAGVLIGVGTNPPLPMEFHGDDLNEDMIMVGSESNPIPVVPDPSPNAPPWMKFFTINRDGQGWSETGAGSMVSVMEFITFPPTTIPGTTIPIRPIDWHEDIDPTVGDGGMFKWAGGEIITPLGPFPGKTSTDGKSIWFDFPALPPGTPIKINKQLMWTGPTITPGPNGTNNYIIKINERPSVPEPTSLALIGLTLAGVAAVARRR